ncbi:hypothetical protein BC829DRAFT_383547 [Chytridium lagenaria]|nr:hypothetical protein BC829DRAFT_383547 [Chytridium lagenaria]
MVNYDKWAKLDDYSSDEDAPRPSVPIDRNTAADPKVILYTVPWDPYCEEIRWALDRHGMSYIEISYPWGLHLWKSLSFSDAKPHAPQLKFPVLENDKQEVYKRDTTDIFMYMFAHSFHNRIRVYSIPEALELQQGFDKELGPAVIRIYVSTILSSPVLVEKYMLSNVHLNTWKAINRLLFPAIRWALYYVLDLKKSSVETAWKTVDKIFGEVERELEKDGGRKYIAGDTLTAADISFSSHATLVLFPNEAEDTFASSLGLKLPSLKELPKDVSAAAKRLRSTKAGKHVLRMYRKERVPKERPEGFRSLLSKHSKENNPWWAKDGGEKLFINLYGCLFTYIVIWGLVIITAPLWALIMFVGMQGAGGYYAYCKYRGSILETRVQQLWFAVFGKHEPTERDLLEQESQKRDNKLKHQDSKLEAARDGIMQQ